MTKLLASTILAAGLMGFAGAASAQEDCGRVTIANMNWASAEVLAHIDQIILEEGYGCDAELVAGDTTPTLTSMIEKGEPDVAPEAWINAMRTVLDKATEEGSLHYAAESLSDGGVEGWWIPKYIADKHPEIKTVEDALDHPEIFPHPDDAEKGGLYNCPEGWGCRINTTNLFKAYEGEEHNFELVETGSAAGLDGSMAKAYESGDPWFGYYWAPTAILGKYEMVKLEFPAEHNKEEWDSCITVPDCADPKPNSWTKSEVYTVVTDRFKQAGGPAYDYLETRSWPNSTVNQLLAWMADNQASGEDAARHFLKENEDIWTEWVTPEAAEKVKKEVM
ncbi:ABC transporter substrate-binding protein [Pseudohoeflea coraliihabitans]|uniref:ABC transporter substrate-binding protein n=1 Tax=Pseudohoeflea coraliihabitans TaxID=2860393 RepID=A0ABS6WIJ6_9HYPH|nr:ABC transporter substrate-binding protein [Pseudohoeflea sp. DP4N28-3]MBW3095762.1 ABC transporter substrate-binding protein [Pseudohoeflea sp. DP4N28-3]